MLGKFSNKSLQTKITIIFITMTIALTGTLGLIFNTNMIETVRGAKEKEVTTLAVETTNKIERFLFERSADIKVLAESKILTSNEISDTIKFDYLNNVIKAYKTYDTVFVLDNQGNIVIASSDIKEEDYGNWKNKMLSDDPYISDFIYDVNSKEYYIYYSYPIYDYEDKLAGAVIEKMNFNAINDIVNNVKLGIKGHAFLEQVADGSSVEDISGVTYDVKNDEKYMTVVYPISKYPTQEKQWVLVIEQPLSEAFLVLYDIEKYFMAAIIVTLLVFFALSNIMSKNITKPIRTLMNKITEISRENKIYASNVSTSDEIKSLTSTFDVLLEELNFLMQRVLEKSGEAAYVEDIKNSMASLFEHMPNGIITIDNKGEITSLNNVAIKILGVEEYELEGDNITNSTSERFVSFFELLSERLFSDEMVKDETGFINGVDNKRTHIVYSTLRQTDMNGTLIGMTVVIQNLEEKQKFEDSIFRAKRLSELGELSAGVAHEIRNPLASIRGYAQWALSEVDEFSQAFSDIQIILHEVDRLDKIIERLMTFAKPDKPKLSKYSINRIIYDTTNLLTKKLDDKGVNIVYELDVKDTICVDYDQIKQVFINLILNSIEAMSGGGTLTIRTSFNKLRGMFDIDISDSGEGIDDDVIEKVFTPFFTTRDDGTGLGLAICSRIIENHDGIIEVASRKGIGTTFTIKLPIKVGNYE